MSKKKVMTHEEHVELAAVLADVHTALQKAIVTTGNKLGVTSTAHKKFIKTSLLYDEARSALDSAYHAVTSNKQFAEQGHVYYGGKPK